MRSGCKVEMWDLFDKESEGKRLVKYVGHEASVRCIEPFDDLLFTGALDGIRFPSLPFPFFSFLFLTNF